MNQFLNRISSFGFIIIILIIIGLVFAEFDNIDKHFPVSPTVASIQQKSKFDNLDILFIGNSYSYSSVQPNILLKSGYNTYNLGIATAGFDFYEIAAKDYINHVNQKPKEIFLLISPMSFSSQSDNFPKYPIHRYLESPVSNFQIAYKYGRINELTIMYKKSIKDGIQNLIKTPKDNKVNEQMLKSRGFVSSEVIITDSIIKNTKHYYTMLKNEKLQYGRLEKLIQVANDIENQEINVVLWHIPTNKLNSLFNNKYLSDYNHAIEKLKVKFDVLIISDSLFSSQHYRNIDHMNSNGALITTQEIIKYLEQRGTNFKE